MRKTPERDRLFRGFKFELYNSPKGHCPSANKPEQLIDMVMMAMQCA